MHRRLFALPAAATIIVAACGGSTGDATDGAAVPSTSAPTTAAAPAAPPTTAASPTTSSTGAAAETPTTTQAPPPSAIADTETPTTAGTAPTETTTTTSADTVSTGDTSAPSDPPGAKTTDAPADPEPGDGSSADPEAPTDTEPPAETDAPAETTDTPGDAEVATVPSTESAGESAAAGLGDSLYPLLGNAGYDVLHYSIELDVDPAANTISSLTTITALATEDLAAFNLDLSGLEVHDVTVDGEAARFSRSGTELTVRPSRAPAVGEEFSVSVGYSGSPEPIDDPGVPFSALGWHWRDGMIYTLSEPSGAMTWFPSNNHPSDKATFELRITVPESTTAAATGLLIDETTADGRTTTTWRMDDPMATYLTAVYVGDFERIEHGRLGPDGPLLRDYVPRKAPPSVGEDLTVTAEVLRFLEDLFGPYPFAAYGTLVLPFDLDLALENQTLPVHGPDYLTTDIIAHEAAHQWLGNSVTLEDWGDIWLNEGFATYVHVMFDTEYHGGDFDAAMQRLHTQLPFIAATPPKRIGLDQLFGPSVYLRGAMTLYALRLYAGDETFFEILRAHYERSAGGTTNTAEFLGIVDEFAGSGAVDLVESWLYDESVPDLPEHRAG